MKLKFLPARWVVGVASVMAAVSITADSQTQWMLVDGTRVPVPPPEHPRLYLRAEHVAELPARLKHPVLQPAFDCVISANPDFRKSWLLHTLEEPVVEAGSATVDCTQHGARGRLNLDVPLPPRFNSRPLAGAEPRQCGDASSRCGGRLGRGVVRSCRRHLDAAPAMKSEHSELV